MFDLGSNDMASADLILYMHACITTCNCSIMILKVSAIASQSESSSHEIYFVINNTWNEKTMVFNNFRAHEMHSQLEVTKILEYKANLTV